MQGHYHGCSKARLKGILSLSHLLALTFALLLLCSPSFFYALSVYSSSNLSPHPSWSLFPSILFSFCALGGQDRAGSIISNEVLNYPGLLFPPWPSASQQKIFQNRRHSQRRARNAGQFAPPHTVKLSLLPCRWAV